MTNFAKSRPMSTARCLMEHALRAEAFEVELHGLRFDHPLIRDVGDLERGEVGLPCHGTDAGEFLAVQRDGDLPRRVIGEDFDIARGLGGAAELSQQLEVFFGSRHGIRNSKSEIQNPSQNPNQWM